MKGIKRYKFYSYKNEGIWVLWFTFKNENYCLFWECNMPIWWLPRVELLKLKNIKGLRMGWLCFSIGFGKSLR